jgi:hypothetical protein
LDLLDSSVGMGMVKGRVGAASIIAAGFAPTALRFFYVA